MRVEGIPLAQPFKDYAQQCQVSDEITATHALDDTSHHPDCNATSTNLRWILLHMIEETARHSGHPAATRAHPLRVWRTAGMS